jgi:hypothetical protein
MPATAGHGRGQDCCAHGRQHLMEQKFLLPVRTGFRCLHDAAHASRIRLKLLILIELYEPSPRWGKRAFCGTEFSGPWKPLGTLWKDFSSIFPFFQLGARRKLAENRFRTHRLFVISRLTVSRFRNLSPVLTPLWKADCDCSSESLTPAMGTLWR